MIALGSQHMSLFGTKQQSRLSSHPQECLACDWFFFVGWSCGATTGTTKSKQGTLEFLPGMSGAGPLLAAPCTHWHCAAQKLKTGLSYKSSQVILFLSLFDQCYWSFDFELDVLLVQWGFCLQIQIDVQHYWATGSDCKVSEYLVIFSRREVSFVVLFQLAEHRKLETRPWITLCLALVSLSHTVTANPCGRSASAKQQETVSHLVSMNNRIIMCTVLFMYWM